MLPYSHKPDGIETMLKPLGGRTWAVRVNCNGVFMCCRKLPTKTITRQSVVAWDLAVEWTILLTHIEYSLQLTYEIK